MKVTVNLYSGKSYPREAVIRQIMYRDPIVCIIDELSPAESVYSILNVSSDMRKYICVANGFDSPKVTTFLASFGEDITTCRVLISAPQDDKRETLAFVENVIRCVNIINGARRINIKKRAYA